MAEDPERPAPTLQHEEGANEATVERNELLREDTDGQEEQGEAASEHSRHRDETSRPHEDRSDRIRRSCSTESQASQQPFSCWHGGIESSEVEEFIYEPAQSPARRSQLFVPEDGDFGSWASPSNPKCPASFGEQGTTATAGAFGQLVQFSDYLGAGNSGMFSASHYYAETPYLVQERARDLHSLALEPFQQAQGRVYTSTIFGLKFMNLDMLDDATPRLRWFQYQWPRYDYIRRSFKDKKDIGLKIQFIVRDRTVFQQCILENWGETDVDIELAFCKGISISDLDHVTNNYEFNKTASNYENAGPGPGGFGWVHVNRFREGSAGARTESQRSMHGEQSSNSQGSCNKKNDPHYGVALVVSIAVDGNVIRFNRGQFPQMWKQTLKAKSSKPGGKSQALVVTAYKLILLENASSDWRTFIVPLKDMNTSRFLREASVIPPLSTSITRISGKDVMAHSYYERHSETLEDKENKDEAGMVNVSQGGDAIAGNNSSKDPSPAVSREPTTQKTSPPLDQIEFSSRRNLEHILGVCAIPVAVNVSEEIADGFIWKKLWDVQPIALTCGDLSGHRISTASSFFAFQFLAEIAKRLGNLPQPNRDDTHVQTLLCRIKDVCLGHLKWLYAAEKTEKGEVFGSLYWVSGEAVIPPESSQSWVPRKHVRNTAFQIIKAALFAESFRGGNVSSSLIGEMISQWGRVWVRWLERSDRRGSLTWDHKEYQGLKVFRLDDHFWIWRALKAMEDKRLGAWEILCGRAQPNDKRSSTDSGAPDVDEMLRCRRKFASQAVQQEVLRNFAAEHGILRTRMVALTRSPRETRFLLHARDTALLYGQDMGFFTENTSVREAWKNTIDVQRFQENNHEAQWDNALRYALALMLGIRGHQINNLEPGVMVRAATEVLLRSSSKNGLFPGKLDVTTKDPLGDVFHLEEDADSCYEAGFEIPYVFLIHAEEIRTIIDESTEPTTVNASVEVNIRRGSPGENPSSTETILTHHTHNPQVEVDQEEKDRELRGLLAQLVDVLSARTYLSNPTSSSDRVGSRELVMDARLALKKTIPLGNVIDSHSIFEIEDEWLFNYPDFLGSENNGEASIDENLGSLKEIKSTWLARIDVAEMRRKYPSHSNEEDRSGANDQSSASSYSSSSIATKGSISTGEPEDSGFVIVDMPSRKRLRGKRVENRATSYEGSFNYVWEHMRKPRTEAKAKKRFIIWTGQDNDMELEAALMCYATSRGDERANMFDFFERHFRHENFMFDHCDLAYNTWDTELHLSFFVLEDASVPLSGAAALNVEGFPGVRGKHISRSSVGLRFHGDAFDRYWTLHMFVDLDINTHDTGKEDAFDSLLSSDWNLLFQRKVFEVRVVSNILDQVQYCTKRILAEVKSEMRIKSGAFSWSIPSMDTYASWNKVWEGFAPLLQALADGLTSAQDLIGQWEAREGARGQEKPRWTHNDERKYRAEITRAQLVLQRRKKGIQDLLKDIESLQEACTARLANAREELSFRSSQNIASFTYVTIVFLPLGFAASVFSMNGYPAAGWVASMVVIAVVALTITATALANAKLLLGVAEQFSKDSQRLTGDVFQSSLIGQQQKQRDEQVQASAEVNKSSHGEQKGGDPRQSHTTSHVLFWMVYLLIELPARRVALACRALPASLMHGLGSLRPDSTPPSEVGSTGAHSEKSTAAVGRKIIRVVGGLLILPLLLISWTLQLFFYNVLDILTFLGRSTRKAFYALVAPSDAHGTASDTKMVTWLIDPPSSLRPVRKFMSRDEQGEKPPPQADTPVSADRSDSGSLDQV